MIVTITARCRATSKTSGNPCGNYVSPGNLVCRAHGGEAAQVLRKSKERLALMSDDAVQALVNILTPHARCETCGRTDADRDPLVLAAAKIVLDKCGIEEVSPEADHDDRWVEWLEEADAEALYAIAERGRARMLEETDGVIDITPDVPRGESQTLARYAPRGDAFGTEDLPQPVQPAAAPAAAATPTEAEPDYEEFDP